MIDVFNIPNIGSSSKAFLPNGNVWQTWQKPNNARFIYFYVIGAGGSGGGGRTGGVNTGGGGGGGGSSSISVGLYPAHLLPDILYIQVGLGSAGAPANTGGSSGALSYVSVQPNTTAINIVMQSGAAAAGGGGGGTTSLGGSAGVAGTVWAYTNNPIAKLGMVSSTAGQAGAAGGGTSAVGLSITPTLTVTGGAGGGGESSSASSYAGGNITGSGFLPTISGGTNNSTTLSAGYPGFMPMTLTSEFLSGQILFFSGGSGGGAAHSASINGGNGGNAAYGSGGGGGGASYQATGGSGGRGGDGFILITCF